MLARRSEAAALLLLCVHVVEIHALLGYALVGAIGMCRKKARHFSDCFRAIKKPHGRVEGKAVYFPERSDVVELFETSLDLLFVFDGRSQDTVIVVSRVIDYFAIGKVRQLLSH